MKQYTFTCPLEGCGSVLTTHAETKEIATSELIGIAQKHLLEVHPSVHKTLEEVTTDVSAHMVEDKTKHS